MLNTKNFNNFRLSVEMTFRCMYEYINIQVYTFKCNILRIVSYCILTYMLLHPQIAIYIILSVQNFINYFGLRNMENISSPVSPSYFCVCDFVVSYFLFGLCYVLLLHNDLWAGGIFSVVSLFSFTQQNKSFIITRDRERGRRRNGGRQGRKEDGNSISYLIVKHVICLSLL